MYLMYQFHDGYKVLAEHYTADQILSEAEIHGGPVRLTVPTAQEAAEFFREAQGDTRSYTDKPDATDEPDAKDFAAVVDVEEPEEIELEPGELSGAILDKLAGYRDMKRFYEKRERCLSKHVAALMRLHGLNIYKSDKRAAFLHNKRGLLIKRRCSDFLQEVLEGV